MIGFDEEWLRTRLAAGNVKVAGSAKSDPRAAKAPPPKSKTLGKPHGGNLCLVLPFKLPTWNQLLAMGHWQRAKVRNWIKEQVSECILNGEDLPTQTGLARRLSLTPLSLAEYSQMITPDSSKKYRTAKRLAK